MRRLFSARRKFTTWRRLWVALAEAERELGLPISAEQIDELKAHIDDLDLARASAIERQTRHDVMAHVRAYGEQCPLARPIIHLGATSCFVGDNTDLILMREGLDLLTERLYAVLDALADFAWRTRGLATLGFTHFQPAQPVTVGKRACLWLQDLLIDLDDLGHVRDSLRFLGSKGTTGTQASFLELFEGDEQKVFQLDDQVAQKMGFTSLYPISGQTYSRKEDARVLQVLSGIAQSAAKMSGDLRLLQHLKEVEEPFEREQIGSSAMAYKRNPMRSERVTALARHVIVNALNPALTASTQWLERTLDDSANKRLAVPETFLAVDAILALLENISRGLVVNEQVIERHLREELPFMACENILMLAVKNGGDRQDLHERIRQHSLDAAEQVKRYGRPNDLLRRIAGDPAFALDVDALDALLDPNQYVGLAPRQVERFLEQTLYPRLEAWKKSKPRRPRSGAEAEPESEQIRV